MRYINVFVTYPICYQSLQPIFPPINPLFNYVVKAEGFEKSLIDGQIQYC